MANQYSPSKMSRVISCSGSPKLIEQVNEYVPSTYARAGNDAHNLGAVCLETGQEPSEYLGKVMSYKDRSGDWSFKVEQSIVDAVTVYTDTVRALMEHDSTLLVEYNVKGKTFTPEDNMYIDAAIINRRLNSLKIIDYKNGVSPVNPEGNIQLTMYALALMEDYDIAPTELELVIVQPNDYTTFKPVKSWAVQFPSVWAKNWLRAIRAAISLAESSEAFYNAGEHCHFCPALHICPEVKGIIKTFKESIEAMSNKYDIPAEELAELLNMAPVVESYIKHIRGLGLSRAQAGADIPGYYLARTSRKARSWRDTEEVKQYLKQFFKVAEIEAKELLSPAKTEALIKRSKKTGIDIKPFIEISITEKETLKQGDNPGKKVETAADKMAKNLQ